MIGKTKATKSAALKLPTVKDLLEAGAHFGHEVKRWNPRFGEYVYTKRGNFHIVDLDKTLQKLAEALKFLQEVSKDGEIVMIGTKRQARDFVKEAAVRSGTHFIINRWVGGLITNFEVVHKGIKRLQEVEKILGGDITEFSQQQLSILRREWGRLNRLFGGVKTLDKLPEAVVVIDGYYEKVAIREAKRAGIPVVALVDSNTDPTNIDYPVPANDDALKSVRLFTNFFADAILAGNQGKGIKHEFKDFERVGVKSPSKSSDALDDLESSEQSKEENGENKVEKRKKVAKDKKEVRKKAGKVSKAKKKKDITKKKSLKSPKKSKKI